MGSLTPNGSAKCRLGGLKTVHLNKELVITQTQYKIDAYNNNRLMALCLGLPRWGGTRRNIHPLTPILIINHFFQLTTSTAIHSILPVQFTSLTVFLHNIFLSPLWSTSWSGTLHFILHTIHHPIIVFFSHHMLIPSQPVLLIYRCVISIKVK